MTDPDDARSDEVEAFWRLARAHAKLSAVPVYFGPSPLESIPPPSWSFGEDDGLAELIAERSATLTAHRGDYGDDDLPSYGGLQIVCDTLGSPRALVATSSVVVTDDLVTEHLTVVWTLEDR